MDILRFVDAVVASPNVQLDLNDGSTWRIDKDGFSAPPPAIRRAGSTTMLTDGGLTAASIYDDRQIVVRLHILASGRNAVATAFQQLARMLDAEGRWLMWQPDGQSPVFFRTRRADVTSMRVYNSTPTDGRQTVTITIPAEPFAWGLKESAQNLVVNNPAGVNPANRLGFTLPAVKGDVTAPLNLSIDWPAVSSNPGVPLIGLLASQAADSSVAPFSFQVGNSASPGDPTSAFTISTVSDSTAAGGSFTRYAATGATEDDAPRLIRFTTPLGSARVFIRAKASGSGCTIRRERGVTSRLYGPRYTAAQTIGTSWGWYDMGVIGTAYQWDGRLDAPGTGGDVTRMVRLKTTATRNIDIDGVLYIAAPAQSAASSSLALIRVEGKSKISPMVFREGIASYEGSESLVVAGGSPKVTPGFTNTVTWMSTLSGPGSPAPTYGTPDADSIDTQLYINWSYYPRYLYTRPASS